MITIRLILILIMILILYEKQTDEVGLLDYTYKFND